MVNFVYMSKFTNPGKAYIGQMQAIGASTLNSLVTLDFHQQLTQMVKLHLSFLKVVLVRINLALQAGSRYYIQGDGTLGTSEANAFS